MKINFLHHLHIQVKFFKPFFLFHNLLYQAAVPTCQINAVVEAAKSVSSYELLDDQINFIFMEFVV